MTAVEAYLREPDAPRRRTLLARIERSTYEQVEAAAEYMLNLTFTDRPPDPG